MDAGDVMVKIDKRLRRRYVCWRLKKRRRKRHALLVSAGVVWRRRRGRRPGIICEKRKRTAFSRATSREEERAAPLGVLDAADVVLRLD
jgi:hypothetical protein